MTKEQRVERNAAVLSAIAHGERPGTVAKRFGLSKATIYLIRHPEKNYQVAAGRKARAAVTRGSLTRPRQCERCGRKRRIEGHHPDYEKPLDVRWLCTFCHHLTHKYQRQGKRLGPHGYVPAAREYQLEAEVNRLRKLLAGARSGLHRACSADDPQETLSILANALRVSSPGPKGAVTLKYVPISWLELPRDQRPRLHVDPLELFREVKP